MKPIIIDMKDMSDSTEVYDKKPKSIYIFFIYIILIMLTAGIIWMVFWKIDIVVKGNGMFVTEDDIYAVSNNVAGEISVCNISEGIYVNEGDVLWEIDTEELIVTKEQTAEKLNDVQQRLEMLYVYQNSLEEESVSFEQFINNKYYGEFVNRKKLLDENIKADSVEEELQINQCERSIESIENSISEYENKIDKLELAKECIKNRKNEFDDSDSYYKNLVANYLWVYDNTNSQYSKKIETMEGNDETDIEALKNECETKLKELELEQISQIEEQIENISNTMITLNANLMTAQAQMELYNSDKLQVTKNVLIMNEKSNISTEILSYEEKKKEYQNNIDTLEKEIEQCVVTADKSGYISLLADVKSGEYINEGAALCNILPEEEKSYYADIYVENADISLIREGQEVKFEIPAYPSDEYGYLTGVIENISKDIKVDEQTGSSFYVIKVLCDKKMVEKIKENEISLMNGMVC